MNLKTAFFVLLLMCIRYCSHGATILTNIVALKEGNKAVISWTAASQTGNKTFVIEKSQNCLSFEKIGETNTCANSNSEKAYMHCDENPGAGIVYYRIKWIDANNIEEVSKIVFIDNSKAIESTIYPCPFKNEMNISLNRDQLPADSQIVIYGNTGRAMYSCEAREFVQLDLSGLTKGIYYVAVESNNKRILEKKVLKEE